MVVGQTSDGTFQADVLDEKSVVLVDFYAPWCGPCKVVSPLIDELAKEITEVKFLKLNVDENPVTAQSYGISGVPTLILFKDGKKINTHVGAVNRQGLKDLIQSSN